jgi:epoxyqueuosine reductase
MDNWMFGCDICQDVCPWNRFSKITHEPRFKSQTKMLNLTTKDWEDLTDNYFQELFQKSAIKRTKFEGLKRNFQFLKKT